ncbi:DMT family transporter [Nonomuraea sp. NPDC048916]|uniref:DMT family transporter n=1 Tax=Nonomuraea sp. NPDC048916 TaxID=3154232 RepID=UPI0033C48058
MLLLFVSAAWGSAFPLMKDLILRLPVEDLLAERYMIAALTLLALRPRCLRGLSRRTWGIGVLLGVVFGVGQTAQAVALDSLPSAVSGFAVGCSVVITPLLALALFQTRILRRVWVGVGLALAGMTVFTLLRGVGEQEISLLALGMTLCAAALYAGHTLLLAWFSRTGKAFNAYALTVIQLATIGVMNGVFAARDGFDLPATVSDWAILAHLSVVSCALGFLARSYAQAYLSAVPSAVLMSSQPLWVTLIAVVWFDEPLSWSMIVGGALLAAAMLLAVPSVNAPPRVRPEASRDRELLAVSRQASQRLADLKIKRNDPLKLGAEPVPFIAKSACARDQACRWDGHSGKGSREPSLERLIERATLIVRARNVSGPGCCQSVTLLGRCLCELMEESEQARMAAKPCWFRAR